MKIVFPLIFQVFILLPGFAEEVPGFVEKFRAEVEKKWQSEIQKFEELDEAETHPDDSILFLGSSSIRLWKNIVDDMAPYHPIQRGFGGSKFSDLAIYADRLIKPHQFRAVVIFVGNDISGKDSDKTPEEVAGFFTYFHGKIREHNKTAPIFYIGVTPTAKRADCWLQAKAANSAIREVCMQTENTFFIGTESIFLDAEGNSKTELFIDDKLHLNELGYGLWAAAIKSHLDSVFDGAGG